MQILFLLTQDLESPSGLGRYWPMARELANSGHKVRIVALHSDFSSLKSRQLIRDGVVVNYVAPMHVIKRGDKKSYYRPYQLAFVVLRATIALSWAALKSPADIIYVGKPHPMNSLAGLLSKVFRRIPIAVDCDDYEAGLGHFSSHWQKYVIEFFEKRVPLMAAAVTTHTHFMQDNLISWGVSQDKVTYLPNGVDQKRFCPPNPDRVEIKRQNLGLENKKVVAYIGSLSLPSHPVHLLVRAFAKIHIELPDSILMIVGGGEDLNNLQRLVTELNLENVTRFVGRVIPEDIPIYYALADISTDPVYDDPTAHGRSPLKLFESWICEVPFVSADVGERAYLMGEPPAGILVSPQQKDGLEMGILTVLTNPILSSELVTLGRVRVQYFLWTELAKQLENILSSCI